MVRNYHNRFTSFKKLFHFKEGGRDNQDLHGNKDTYKIYCTFEPFNTNPTTQTYGEIKDHPQGFSKDALVDNAACQFANGGKLLLL